jgi:hypothetical protein
MIRQNCRFAVDGDGKVTYEFTNGSMGSLAIDPGDAQQLEIDHFDSRRLKMGRASHVWTHVDLFEGSGDEPFVIRVTTEASASTTLRIPGATDEHISAGQLVVLKYIRFDDQDDNSLLNPFGYSVTRTPA